MTRRRLLEENVLRHKNSTHSQSDKVLRKAKAKVIFFCLQARLQRVQSSFVLVYGGRGAHLQEFITRSSDAVRVAGGHGIRVDVIRLQLFKNTVTGKICENF